MDSIKILFILSNAEVRNAILEATSIKYAIQKCSVEIELTDEQMKILNLRIIGSSNNKDIYEEIESVSISSIDLDKNLIRLLFVFNDWWVQSEICVYSGVLNNVRRRAVEIELTKEQVEKINIHKISIHNITDFEIIESVSLMY